MNTGKSEQNDNELDFADIIRSLWDGKWLIIGTTAITSIMMVTYLKVVPQTYRGVLEIYPISIIETSQYEELNNSKLLNPDGENPDGEEGDSQKLSGHQLDYKKLELLFMQDLLTYKGFEASIMENMYLEKDENETELDFFARIKGAARSFSLSKLENIWTLSITTQQPNLVHKVISDALALSNNNVNMQVERDLVRLLKSHSRRVLKELEDIKISSKNLLNYEKLKTQSRLAFLAEQRAIARTLDIDKNTQVSSKNPVIKDGYYVPQKSKKLGLIYEEVEPYYLRGYLTIDKEIEILLARKSPELFIPEFLTNELKKYRLLEDKTISRAKKIISLTPIGTDKFKSVSYDIASINLNRKTRLLVPLVLSVILGGMIGVIILGFRHAVIRNR
jgi:LPS O-antigen subunit length determinant protein (WzzB/FepE family)